MHREVESQGGLAVRVIIVKLLTQSRLEFGAFMRNVL